MKYYIISILTVVAILTGCTSDQQKNAINKDEVIARLSLEDKAHFVIGTGMAGFDGENAVIGATRALVPGAAGTT